MSKKAKLRFVIFIATITNFLAFPVWAQLEVPQVTPTIRLGNMTLHLTEQAQRDIQADVDALYRSQKYFLLKLERVDMYMPIIEPILAEYGVPDEVKYLVIQESALISDAVSSSNAVGFWQFKETSATELGMRVDRQVDERINIVSSTIGACKYLLRSNATFDNWLYSLQSYQMGLGGASRALDKRYYGAREMKIDSDTYWYVRKFLSHIIAFQDAVGKQPHNLMLYQFKNTANKSLEDISNEFGTDHDQLLEYNKWLKTSRVPDDKPYVVIIPVLLEEAPNLLAENQATAKKKKTNQQALEDRLFGEKQKQPNVPPAVLDKLAVAEINGLRAAVARQGDNARDLASVGNISVADFLRYNDIKPGDVLQPGQVYYFKKKKKKASVYRHVAAEGESLWDISQKYGVRLDKLLQKNRLKERDQIMPGQVVWLRHIRPAKEPITYEAVPKRSDEAKAVKQPLAPQQKFTKAVAPAPAIEKQPLSSKKEVEQLTQQEPAEKEKQAQQQAQVQQQVVEVSKQQQPAQQETIIKGKQQPSVQPQQSQQVLTATTEAVPYNVQKQQEPVEQQVTPAVVQVDTPRTESLSVQEAPLQADSTEEEIAVEMHLYPGNVADERNVYLQNQEKGQPVQQLPKHTVNPDSFAAVGTVKFIGEEGQPLEKPQPPQYVSSATQQPTIAENRPVQSQAQPQQPAQPVIPAQDTAYVVQAGETLYSISKKHGLSVQELRKRNDMGADAVLSIGQVLRLQEKKSVAGAAPKEAVKPLATETDSLVQAAATATLEDDKYFYHAVAEGETMYRVARKYNVTIKDIMEWNKRADFNIRPGEQLIVGRK